MRSEAARLLGRAGEHQRSVAALIEALAREEAFDVRGEILEALARRGDDSVIDALADLLGEWAAASHIAALEVMGAIGGEVAVRTLVDWLGATDEGLNAAEALVHIGAPAVPRLIRALGIPIASRNAAIALGRIGDTRATIPLVSELRRAQPSARVEMLRALGRIGDERASPAIVRALRDSDPVAVSAALGALARLAGPEHAQPVASLADRGTSEQRAAALEALVVMDPVAAAPRLEAVFSDAQAPAILRSVAIESVLSRPTEHSIPALEALMEVPARRLAVAEALARIEGGRGVPLLLERARLDEERSLDPALALALRRSEGGLDRGLRAQALEHLRADRSSRGLVLRALALDPSVVSATARAIESAEVRERAHGALAAWLLGERATSLGSGISARLATERDPAVFRALALAALRGGVPVELARIDARWWDPSTAPEALWLAGANMGGAPPRIQRRARRAMRRSLRAAQPRVRAGAALALAIAADRGAWRALVASLDDEHDFVRLAVARALEALGEPRAAPAIAARARVERQEAVRLALIDASRSASRRTPPPIRVGDTVFYARVSTAAGLARGPDLGVDVLLADGRWLRTLTLSTGEVLVPDLPAGEAEVQVRLEHRTP